MKEPKLSFKHSESIASIFLCLSEFLISRGSRGIITTLAFWHCGRHYLYYQRWKHILCYNLFEKFKLLSCLSMFWILPCHPEFHNLTYYDLKKKIQISRYLLKFDIKESPIPISNIIATTKNYVLQFFHTSQVSHFLEQQ